MADLSRIVVDPNIRFGKPCIRGRRIAVEDILLRSAEGATADWIIEQYELERADVVAAFAYAARMLQKKFR